MSSVCIAFACGCQRSQVDVAKLFKYFEANGWELKKRVEGADLVIVATCGFDLSNEQNSMKLVAAADRRRKPGSRMVLIGCLAGINEGLLKESFTATVIAPSALDQLDEVIDASVKLSEVDDVHMLEPYIGRAVEAFDHSDWHGTEGTVSALLRKALTVLGARKPLKKLGLVRPRRTNLEPTGDIFTIRVGSGCLGECTYCGIRFACGTLRSVPLQRVLDAFDTGLREGHAEFKIIAQDIGPYGVDIGTNVVELMRGLFGRKEDFKLTLLDIDPKYFIQHAGELTRLFQANATRIRLIMMPVQSGSERILGLMRRGHSARDARECLCALKKGAPELQIATHVLVGFPGETEADFEDTVSFLRAVRFDRLDVYESCDRPKTQACLLPDKVSEDVKRSRVERLQREFNVTSW